MSQNRTTEQIRYHTDFLRQSMVDFAAEIAAHLPNESTKDFLITIKSFMIALNASFSQQYDPIEFIEADLHHIWHMVIEVAKLTESEDSTHDRLVTLLLYFRELGTLHRKVDGVEESAVMGNGGRVWTDLPYFPSDLTEEWRRWSGMTTKQRVGLATFTGRCVTLGVGGIGVTACAVCTIEEALGEELTASGKEGGAVVELLPVCTILFQQCGHKLLALCIDNKAPIHGDVVSVFEPTAFIEVLMNTLHMGRWLSWRKELQYLSRSQDEVVAKEAKHGFNAMICCGREMGYVVKGEERYWDKVIMLLSDELKRSGKGSVGLEDIVTDPQWAE
jgi:hypothetical protein